MENHKKEIENEDEIDVRKIYLRNFKPHQPRVGKQYQAIIPDCISPPPKKKEIPKGNENINLKKENESITKNNNKEKIENNEPIEKGKVEKIKNDLIGHKTYESNNKDEEKDEYYPSKKKKINNES